MNITELRAAYNEAVQRMNEAADAFQNLPTEGDEGDGGNGDDDAVATAERAFNDAKAEVERRRANLDRYQAVVEARAANPIIETPVGEPAIQTNTLGPQVTVGREEHTYRPDRIGSVSFFADQVRARHGDREARERLDRNREECRIHLNLEERDMQNASTQGSEFLPPLYLGDLFVTPSVEGRPFANALPTLPLPPFGTAITIPKLSSGVAVAARSDAGSVQETDGVTTTVTATVNEISGQVDIGRIAVMRSDPGLDVVIGAELIKQYNSYLDTQLLSGSGSAPQHDGLRNVGSANTTSYTDASPTAAELVPKIYEAISEITVARKDDPDLIVMHPRRAAWLASNLSSTFPLFQLGSLYQAAGQQDNGFVGNFAGLQVVRDSNIGTTYGSSTNEDEIYVLVKRDFILMEGPLMSRVWDDVGSGTGVIRYQVFAHSAYLSNRYPESLSIISGTGLVAPSF